MAIETLRRYLSDEDLELRRVLSVLFKGIVTTAVRADEEDWAGLKNDIERIDATIEGEFTTEHLLVAAGAAVQALDSYNQRTTRFTRRQGIELQKIIAMLAESVITITGSSERSVQALGKIQANLEHAGGLEDLQNVKAQLSMCLEQVCQESVRRRKEADASIAQLQQHIQRAESHLTPTHDIDPITDLPVRPAADAALAVALAKPGRKYVGVLVLDRLKSINARFGDEVGDRVLAELARHIRTNLPAGDLLFRWSGPTLVAVMPRQCSIDRMRTDLNAIFGKPIQREFTIAGRTVLIPISAAWAVFALIPPLATILKHVDTFAANQAPLDYL
jgi:diguanylate cyclase (GGDEF)-like protein